MISVTLETNQKLSKLASDYANALAKCDGESLVSVVLYGSVARQEASPTSDIDLLIIIKGLPKGQFARKERLAEADKLIFPALESLSKQGIETSFTRVIKTPEEASHIVPLYLDLVDDAVFLIDKQGFFKNILSQLRNRLNQLGARRISSGRVRYWDLKPDIQPGETFEI